MVTIICKESALFLQRPEQTQARISALGSRTSKACPPPTLNSETNHSRKSRSDCTAQEPAFHVAEDTLDIFSVPGDSIAPATLEHVHKGEVKRLIKSGCAHPKRTVKHAKSIHKS